MATGMDSWQTAISSIEDDDIRVRGESLGHLIGNTSFAEVVFLALTGQRASGGQGRVLDGLLVSLVDHGISPSITITRMLASYGVPLQAGLAGGVLSIGDRHAGACEQLARDMYESVDQGAKPEVVGKVAETYVREARADRRKIHGFGHPQHGADPRASWLFQLAKAEGVWGTYCALVEAIEAALSDSIGRRLPINVDGVCAALVLDLGLPWQSTRGIIAMSRITGMTAHFIEEEQIDSAWRHIPDQWIEYLPPDGGQG